MNQSGQILIQPPSPVALHFISLFFRSRRLFCVRLPRPLCVLSFFTSFASFVFLFSFSSLRSFPPSSCFVPFLHSFTASFFPYFFCFVAPSFFCLFFVCLFIHSHLLFLLLLSSFFSSFSPTSFVSYLLLLCIRIFFSVLSLFYLLAHWHHLLSCLVFFVHSHLLPIFFLRLFTLPFLHSHLVSILFFSLRLFAPSFYSVSFFFIRLHLLSFMFPSFVVYHIYSILFIFFVHSHLLSILNVSLIPSCFPLLCCVDSFRHCFCVVYFLTPFAPPVCSPVRLPLFENPSSKQRKFR